jgi:hypothetical protein
VLGEDDEHVDHHQPVRIEAARAPGASCTGVPTMAFSSEVDTGSPEENVKTRI